MHTLHRPTNDSRCTGTQQNMQSNGDNACNNTSKKYKIGSFQDGLLFHRAEKMVTRVKTMQSVRLSPSITQAISLRNFGVIPHLEVCCLYAMDSSRSNELLPLTLGAPRRRSRPGPATATGSLLQPGDGRALGPVHRVAPPDLPAGSGWQA